MNVVKAQWKGNHPIIIHHQKNNITYKYQTCFTSRSCIFYLNLARFPFHVKIGFFFGVYVGLSWHYVGLSWLHLGSSWLMWESCWVMLPHVGLMLAPRGSKMALCWPKLALRRPKWSPEASKMLQKCFRKASRWGKNRDFWGLSSKNAKMHLELL